MKFFLEVNQGRLTLLSSQKILRQHFLNSLKDGTQVIETITRESKSKSHQQVKGHFGLVVAMVRQAMIDLGWSICGVAPNIPMVHDILKKACSGVGDGGECLGLSEMTTTQASAFFENCRNWAANELHIVIPDYNPNWKEDRNEKQVGER